MTAILDGQNKIESKILNFRTWCEDVGSFRLPMMDSGLFTRVVVQNRQKAVGSDAEWPLIQFLSADMSKRIDSWAMRSMIVMTWWFNSSNEANSRSLLVPCSAKLYDQGSEVFLDIPTPVDNPLNMRLVQFIPVEDPETIKMQTFMPSEFSRENACEITASYFTGEPSEWFVFVPNRETGWNCLSLFAAYASGKPIDRHRPLELSIPPFASHIAFPGGVNMVLEWKRSDQSSWTRFRTLQDVQPDGSYCYAILPRLGAVAGNSIDKPFLVNDLQVRMRPKVIGRQYPVLLWTEAFDPAEGVVKKMQEWQGWLSQESSIEISVLGVVEGACKDWSREGLQAATPTSILHYRAGCKSDVRAVDVDRSYWHSSPRGVDVPDAACGEYRSRNTTDGGAVCSSLLPPAYNSVCSTARPPSYSRASVGRRFYEKKCTVPALDQSLGIALRALFVEGIQGKGVNARHSRHAWIGTGQIVFIPDSALFSLPSLSECFTVNGLQEWLDATIFKACVERECS